MIKKRGIYILYTKGKKIDEMRDADDGFVLYDIHIESSCVGVRVRDIIDRLVISRIRCV